MKILIITVMMAMYGGPKNSKVIYKPKNPIKPTNEDTFYKRKTLLLARDLYLETA